MTKKRANGEGSVFKRNDGRVVGVYDDANGRTRYMTSRTMSKTEMKAAIRKKPEERDNGVAYDSEGLIVEKYLDRWLESIRDRVRLGTFKPYEAIVRVSHYYRTPHPMPGLFDPRYPLHRSIQGVSETEWICDSTKVSCAFPTCINTQILHRYNDYWR